MPKASRHKSLFWRRFLGLRFRPRVSCPNTVLIGRALTVRSAPVIRSGSNSVEEAERAFCVRRRAFLINRSHKSPGVDRAGVGRRQGPFSGGGNPCRAGKN